MTEKTQGGVYILSADGTKKARLNQTQIDAILPVIQENMVKRISKKKFNQMCLDALSAAGVSPVFE